MAYGIYLSAADGSDAFQIPVLPETIGIKEQGQGKTYTIAKLGEINVIKEPKLTEISFDSFLPAQVYPFVIVQNLLDPSVYMNRIQKWREAKQVVRFVFTGSTVDINMTVSIEEFTWKEKAGSVGDIEYSLSLKRYVYHEPKKATIKLEQKKATITTKKARTDTKKAPATYRLVRGDSLWKVAQKFLGKGSRYKEIQKLNGIKDSQIRKLPVGLVVKLPPK